MSLDCIKIKFLEQVALTTRDKYTLLWFLGFLFYPIRNRENSHHPIRDAWIRKPVECQSTAYFFDLFRICYWCWVGRNLRVIQVSFFKDRCHVKPIATVWIALIVVDGVECNLVYHQTISTASDAHDCYQSFSGFLSFTERRGSQ